MKSAYQTLSWQPSGKSPSFPSFPTKISVAEMAFVNTVCRKVAAVWEKHPKPEDRLVYGLLALSCFPSAEPSYATALGQWKTLCLTTVNRCLCSRHNISPIASNVGDSYVMQNVHNGIRIVIGAQCCLSNFSAASKRPCHTCNRHKIELSKPEWITVCKDCVRKKARMCMCCKAKRIPHSFPLWKRTCTACTTRLAMKKR